MAERMNAFEKKLNDKGVLSEYRARIKYLIDEEGQNTANAKSKATKEFKEKYLPESGPDDIVEPTWCKLNRKDFEGKPEITWLQGVMWAIKNCGYADATQRDAPSEPAWQLLVLFRLEPKFYKDTIKGLMPRTSQADSNNDRFNDDGRKHFTLVGKLQSEYAEDKNTVLPPGSKEDNS